jgi:hypothetical protein
MRQISLNILNFAARTRFFFGRAASRALRAPLVRGALASGYPLHHLRAFFRTSGASFTPFGGSAAIPLACAGFARELKIKN